MRRLQGPAAAGACDSFSFHLSAASASRFAGCSASLPQPRQDHRNKPWQVNILNYCKTIELNETQTGPKDPKGWIKGMREQEFFKGLTKEENKKAMPFAAFMMNDEMSIRGPEALALELPFDEKDMLEARLDLIQYQLGIKDIVLRHASEGAHEEAHGMLEVVRDAMRIRDQRARQAAGALPDEDEQDAS